VTVRTYPNQKQWIKGNIRIKLKARAAAFKEWETNLEAYKKSCYALRRTIKQAKCQSMIKIESCSDARRMWQGLKTITDYKGKPRRELPSDASLPDELNPFYACFEASNTEACTRAPVVLDDCVKTLSVADVNKTFLNRPRFTKPLGQTDYQGVYSKHARTNCQVSLLTFSTAP
jgi:hypothetical protein